MYLHYQYIYSTRSRTLPVHVHPQYIQYTITCINITNTYTAPVHVHHQYMYRTSTSTKHDHCSAPVLVPLRSSGGGRTSSPGTEPLQYLVSERGFLFHILEFYTYIIPLRRILTCSILKVYLPVTLSVT